MTESIDIRLDDLSNGHVIQLLDEHRQEMLLHSPPESVHALDIAGLHAAEITFWSAWFADNFAGCGALKMLNEGHAEIKSMKTRPEFLRRGVAESLLNHILQEAKTRGLSRVSLETGSMDVFIPARTLYEKVGFVECPAFADYFEDPHSVCMTKLLT